LKIDSDAQTILVGFQDGCVRVYKLSSKAGSDSTLDLGLYEVFKPHTSSVTHVAVDSKSSNVATAVSY
jgi:hypothetical protein